MTQRGRTDRAGSPPGPRRVRPVAGTQRHGLGPPSGSALYQARLGDLQAEVADDPAEGDAWREVDQRVVAWRSQVTEPTIQLRREVAAGRASLDDLAALDRTGEPARQFEAVRAAFAQAIQARERLLAEQTQAADEANAALQRLLIAGIVAAAVVGVGVAWLLTWHLTRPVALLARTARAIADGDLSRRVNLTRRDEVEATWSIVTPILEAWPHLPTPDFPNYPAGTWGPQASLDLVERDGSTWREA